MSFTHSELEELLRLALTALHGQALAAGMPPPAPASLPAQASAGPSLAEWLVTYRKVIAERGYNEQTLKNRATSLKYIEATWGALALRSTWLVDIASRLKRWTPHTAGRILGELRDVFVEAIAHGKAETSPATHVKAPRAPGLRKRLRIETWRSMLTLALHTD